jgi:hypothetical protein
VLLIGTGPPMLFQAIALAETGQRVLLLDAAPIPGGSWHLPDVLGFRSVEVGCHLIESRPLIHRVIANLLPAQEIRRGTPDFGLWHGRRIPMPLARVLLYGLVGAKAALRGDGGKTWHSAVNMARSLRHVGLPMLYPRRGHAAVLAAALTRLEAAGAGIHLGCRVTRVQIGAAGVVAETAAGPVRARHLVMSSRAHAPVEGLEGLWEGCQQQRTHSLVLHLEGPAPRFDGYVEVIGHPVIKRARNVTGFAVPAVPAGQALVTVQFRDDPGQDAAPVLGARAADWLGLLGLLAPGTRPCGAYRDDVELATLPARALRAIARRHGDRVTLLRSVDLGDQAYPVQPGPGAAADPGPPGRG